MAVQNDPTPVPITHTDSSLRSPSTPQDSDCSKIVQCVLKVLAGLVASLIIGCATASLGLIPIVAVNFGLAAVIVFGITGFGFTATLMYHLLRSSNSSQNTPIPPPAPATTAIAAPPAAAEPAPPPPSKSDTTPNIPTGTGTLPLDAVQSPMPHKSPIETKGDRPDPGPAIPPAPPTKPDSPRKTITPSQALLINPTAPLSETASLDELLVAFYKISQKPGQLDANIKSLKELLPRLIKAANGKKCIDGHRILPMLILIAAKKSNHKPSSDDGKAKVATLINELLQPLLNLIDLEKPNMDGDTLLLSTLKSTAIQAPQQRPGAKPMSPQRNDSVLPPIDPLITVLLALGANVKHVDKHQNTALHIAAEHAQHLVSLLLHYNPEVNCLNAKKEAPIHILFAAKKINLRACIRLIEAPGIDLNIPYSKANSGKIQEGSYPLHQAIRLKRKKEIDLSIIEAMLKKGANPNLAVVTKIKLKVPETPLTLGIGHKDMDVITVLLKYGAIVDEATLAFAKPGSTLIGSETKFMLVLEDAKRKQDAANGVITDAQPDAVANHKESSSEAVIELS